MVCMRSVGSAVITLTLVYHARIHHREVVVPVATQAMRVYAPLSTILMCNTIGIHCVSLGIMVAMLMEFTSSAVSAAEVTSWMFVVLDRKFVHSSNSHHCHTIGIQIVSMEAWDAMQMASTLSVGSVLKDHLKMCLVQIQ